MEAQISKKQLVGRIDDNYYVCDYLFGQGKSFKGVVASVLRPVSADEVDDRTNPNNPDTLDWFYDLWSMAVDGRRTEDSLQTFVSQVLAIDGEEAVFDMGSSEYWDLIREAVPELTEEDYPIFECVGGGRSFSPDMKWDELYNAELWAEIQTYETD